MRPDPVLGCERCGDATCAYRDDQARPRSQQIGCLPPCRAIDWRTFASTLVTEQREAVSGARKNEMNRCARSVCSRCFEGQPVEYLDGYGWSHGVRDGQIVDCRASQVWTQRDGRLHTRWLSDRMRGCPRVL